MKKTGGYLFILGVIVGAVAFGGSVAVAAGIMAQAKTATVVIDGKTVDLKGYLIEGAHYFQLRDLDEKLKPGGKDFSVVWDGDGNRVLIDTSRGYDPKEQYNPNAGMTLDEMRTEIIRLTNAERVKAGIPELAVLPELMDCAQAKAQDFKDSHYYGHISPVYRSPGDMIRSFVPKAKSVGENIAPWTRTPAEAFAGWVESPEHYANMINPKYTHIGVGIVEGVSGGYWWVQQLAQLP